MESKGSWTTLDIGYQRSPRPKLIEMFSKMRVQLVMFIEYKIMIHVKLL